MTKGIRLTRCLCIALSCLVESIVPDSANAENASLQSHPVAQSATATGGGSAINVSSGGSTTINFKDPESDRRSAATERTLRKMDRTLRIVAESMAESNKATASIRARSRQPGADPTVRAAALAIDSGNTAPAEALLRQQEESLAQRAGNADAQAAEDRKQAAELARQQGALAFLTDKRAALIAYKRAAQYEPDDARTQILIGDLQLLNGDTQQAHTTFVNAASIAKANLAARPGDVDIQRSLAVIHNRIGEVREAQGDLRGAQDEYQQALTSLDDQTAQFPNNSGLWRDLAATHANLGRIIKAQGDLSKAGVEIRKSNAISERLAQQEAGNPQFQLDLAAGHLRLGGLLDLQDDTSGALDEARRGTTIAEAVARGGQSASGRTRELAVAHLDADALRIAAHQEIGSILTGQGDLAGSLVAYEQALRIAESLAKQDPNNNDWQRSAATTLGESAMTRMLQGDSVRGLIDSKRAVAILETACANDPTNVELQSDLAAMRSGAAFAMAATGDLDGALAQDRQAIEMLDSLVRQEHAFDDRTLLALDHSLVSSLLDYRHDVDAAIAESRQAIAVLESQDGQVPPVEVVHKPLAEAHFLLATELEEKGDEADAAAALRVARTGLEEIARRDPTNDTAQMEFADALIMTAGNLKSEGRQADADAAITEALKLLDSVAQRNPDNIMAQVSLAAACLTFGHVTEVAERRKAVLERGLSIMKTLTNQNRWPKNIVDLTPRFEEALAKL